MEIAGLVSGSTTEPNTEDVTNYSFKRGNRRRGRENCV
jgi:hypothetical protein